MDWGDGVGKGGGPPCLSPNLEWKYGTRRHLGVSGLVVLGIGIPMCESVIVAGGQENKNK